ncbi:MAG: GNAT family N-acetyltransferase [Ignavibacteriae bacterium]|nr:GNAT family N-acetyltransferase [Ignavibacteriota bacterium]MCB9217511.1 GNAT family N-acetyltransferase [Ignavibacteria bacterium]
MISYTETMDNITPEMLGGFFEGWPNPPSPETHLKILRGSYSVVLALDEGRVVGFVNAISDGHLMAFLPLLEVLPEYRGQGIGSELVRQISQTLSGLYALDLICDSDVQPFYERLGWLRTNGMSARNYNRQSGT